MSITSEIQPRDCKSPALAHVAVAGREVTKPRSAPASVSAAPCGAAGAGCPGTGTGQARHGTGSLARPLGARQGRGRLLLGAGCSRTRGVTARGELPGIPGSVGHKNLGELREDARMSGTIPSVRGEGMLEVVFMLLGPRS